MKTLTVSLTVAIMLFVGCGDTSSDTSEDNLATNGGNGSSQEISEEATSSSASSILTLTPVTNVIACDPPKMESYPYTDRKYSAEGGSITITCDPQSKFLDGIALSFKNGETLIDLKKVYIESLSDNGDRRFKTTTLYTPQNVTITTFHTRDSDGNLLQESCTTTYSPIALTSLNSDDLHKIIDNSFLNTESPLSSDCQGLINGDPVSGSTQEQIYQNNFIFTPETGEETKVYSEVKSYHGSI